MAKSYEIAFKLGAQLTSSFQKAFKDAKNSFKSLEQAGKRLRQVGGTMTMAITAPIAGMGAAAIKTGMNFETSMSKVQALSGATAEEMAKLSAQAREMGATTAFSAIEAADAQAFLAMAGYDTAQIMSSLPSLLNLAAAGQLDLGRAADITTNIMSGFNIEAEKTEQVADILAKAASSANTSVEQMGSAMSYVAPVAAGAGIAIEETAAAIGILSNAGIQGERAGTTLRSMIASLQNPTGQTAKALEDLGLTADDVNPSIHSLSDILRTLEEAGMDSSQAMQLVGVEAGPGLLALLSQGSKGLQDFTNQLENSAGAAANMAEIMTDNLAGDWNQFTSALTELGLQIYDIVQPMLRSLTQMATSVVQWLQDLSPPLKLAAVGFAGFVASIGPAILVAGLFASSISSILTAATGMRTVMKGTGAAISAFNNPIGRAIILTKLWQSAQALLNKTLLRNPFVLTVTAITLLGTALVTAYKKSEAFRNVVDKSFSYVKNTVQSTVDYISRVAPQMWDTFVESVKGIGTRIATVIGQELPDGVKKIISGFAGQFKSGLSSVGGIASMVAPTLATIGLSFLGVSGPIGLAISAILSFVGFIYRLSQSNENVKNTLVTAWQSIQETISSALTALQPIFDVFKNNFSETMEQLGPEFEKTGQVIAESIQELGPVFGELADTIVQIGPTIAEVFSTWISFTVELSSAVLPVLLQTIQQVFPLILSVIQAVLPIVIELFTSVLTVIMQVATMVLPILMQAAQMVLPMILSIVQSVLPIIVTLFTNVIEVIMQIVNAVLPILLQVVETVFPIILAVVQAAIPVVAGLLEGVATIIQGVVVPAIQLILQVVQAVFPVITSIIETAISVITSIMQVGMALVKGDWEAAWNKIKQIGETIMNNIISFFESINLFEIGQNIIQGLIDGIKGMAGKVVDSVKGVVDGAIEGAKKLLGIASPSKLFFQFGEWVDQGFIDGIASMISDVEQAGKHLGEASVIGADEGISGTESPLSVPDTGFTRGDSSPISITVHNKQKIIIESSEVDRGEVERQVNNSNRSLLDELKEIIRDEERLSFG